VRTLSRRSVVGGMAGTAALAVASPAATAGISPEPATDQQPQAGADRGTAPGAAGAIQPVRLTTEHAENPLGIGTAAPRFGWQLVANGHDRAQSAYQIVVASSPDRLTTKPTEPDIWDTGRVSSPDQTALVYAGPALRSRTRYHWAVRAWDERGRPGPYSAPAWFETALLDEDEWTADWIGSGIVVPPPVRVLAPQQFEPTSLAGHVLGQSFASKGPLVAVAVLLAIPPDQTGSCRMTLRQHGPDGSVLTLDIQVPVNAVAELVLPDRDQRLLGSGRYHIVTPIS
jgi:alpha-L-rhamnosidase